MSLPLHTHTQVLQPPGKVCWDVTAVDSKVIIDCMIVPWVTRCEEECHMLQGLLELHWPSHEKQQIIAYHATSSMKEPSMFLFHKLRVSQFQGFQTPAVLYIQSNTSVKSHMEQHLKSLSLFQNVAAYAWISVWLWNYQGVYLGCAWVTHRHVLLLPPNTLNLGQGCRMSSPVWNLRALIWFPFSYLHSHFSAYSSYSFGLVIFLQMVHSPDFFL